MDGSLFLIGYKVGFNLGEFVQRAHAMIDNCWNLRIHGHGHFNPRCNYALDGMPGLSNDE